MALIEMEAGTTADMLYWLYASLDELIDMPLPEPPKEAAK